DRADDAGPPILHRHGRGSGRLRLRTAGAPARTPHTMTPLSARKLLSGARLAGQLVRTQGTGWLAFRVAHALRLRSGLMRWRLPATSWDEQPLAGFLCEPALARPETFLAYRREQAPP